MARWLLKSEPDVFSYDDLVRAGREGWDGIRSYQARNFLREMRRGEQAIFYHSNAKPPGVAGICKVVKTAEPDPTQFDPNSKYYDPASKPGDPRWDWVTVAPVRALPFVSLDELRGLPELADCRLLAKGNRLSVLPLRDAEFDAIVGFARRRGLRPSVATSPRNSGRMPETFPTLRSVVFDTTDARGLAEFYRKLLGYDYRPGDDRPPPGEPDPAGQDWLVLVDPNGKARLAFQQVKKLAPSTWPEDGVPQQLHLDVTVPTSEELIAQHERVLSLGARLLHDRFDDPVEPLYVYADPAGHPFCIFVA